MKKYIMILGLALALVACRKEEEIVEEEVITETEALAGPSQVAEDFLSALKDLDFDQMDSLSTGKSELSLALDRPGKEGEIVREVLKRTDFSLVSLDEKEESASLDYEMKAPGLESLAKKIASKNIGKILSGAPIEEFDIGIDYDGIEKESYDLKLGLDKENDQWLVDTASSQDLEDFINKLN